MDRQYDSTHFNPETVRRIWAKANRLRDQAKRHGLDFEDLLQDFALQLHRASLKYDPIKMEWQAFVRMVLSRHETTLRRRFASKKRSACNTVYGLGTDEDASCITNQLAQDQRGSHRSYLQGDDLARLQLRLDVAAVVGCLPVRLRNIAKRLPYQSIKEIAEEIGIDRGTVSRRLRDIRRCFEKAELAAYLTK